MAGSSSLFFTVEILCKSLLIIHELFFFKYLMSEQLVFAMMEKSSCLYISDGLYMLGSLTQFKWRQKKKQS